MNKARALTHEELLDYIVNHRESVAVSDVDISKLETFGTIEPAIELRLRVPYLAVHNYFDKKWQEKRL